MAARRTPVLLWCAALVAVPTVLAGVSTVWPGAPAGASAVAAPATPDPAMSDPAMSGSVASGPGDTSVATAVAPDSAVTVAGAPAGRADDGSAPTAPAPTAGTLPAADQVAALTAASPVLFAPDSAELGPDAAGTVRAIAEALAAAPDASVLLVGHVADTPGPPETAQLLSEQRAEAVADALVAGGVDRARITTVGRGAAEPRDTRAASRRVEFEIR